MSFILNNFKFQTKKRKKYKKNSQNNRFQSKMAYIPMIIITIFFLTIFLLEFLVPLYFPEVEKIGQNKQNSNPQRNIKTKGINRFQCENINANTDENSPKTKETSIDTVFNFKNFIHKYSPFVKLISIIIGYILIVMGIVFYISKYLITLN